MSGSNDLPQCSKTLPPPPGPKKYDLCQKVVSAMARIKSWSEDEQFELTSELIKFFRQDTEKSKKLMNLARDQMAKSKKNANTIPAIPPPPPAPRVEVCGQQRNADPGASGVEEDASVAASKVSMICRGDILANTELLFFDTEKVTISKSHKNMSGDLAIVDIQGQLLFWTYIHQENVCKFNTKISGLDDSKMAMGLDVETLKVILKKLLHQKEIWGAKASDDAKSLGFSEGFFPTSLATKDIQTFYRDHKDRPIGLAQLSEHYLGENVQSKTHSSIAHARVTALCYKKMMIFKDLGMTRFSCPVMDEIREEKVPKQQIKYDKCT